MTYILSNSCILTCFIFTVTILLFFVQQNFSNVPMKSGCNFSLPSMLQQNNTVSLPLYFFLPCYVSPSIMMNVIKQCNFNHSQFSAASTTYGRRFSDTVLCCCLNLCSQPFQHLNSTPIFSAISDSSCNAGPSIKIVVA